MTRVSAVVQGQRPMADPPDVFTMLQVLAKSYAALLSLVDRSEHHERQTRTIGANFGEVGGVKTHVSDIEDNITVQVSTGGVMKSMADVLNTGGGKGEGGSKFVSEHKSIQQLRNFGGYHSKFR